MNNNTSKIHVNNNRTLIDGYIHEIQIKLSSHTIPTTINILILQYYISKYGQSRLIFITHDNNPRLTKIEPYSSSASIKCIATLKLYNLKSNTKQSITITNDKIYNDARQCYGLCFIPNINVLPSSIKTAEKKDDSNIHNYSLLYRFGEDIECIAFNANDHNDKIKGYVTKFENNDPGQDTQNETGTYRKYFPMIYNHKRNSILFVGGAFKKYGFRFSKNGDIGEYNLNTNKFKMLGYSGGTRAVWPNICLIDDDNKLFICGGRTRICLTDSLCPCSIQTSVNLFDLENKECVSLKGMNIQREGHGCCYNYELNRVVVGGGTTDWRGKPVMDSAKSVEIYDIEKNEWILIKNECNYQYRYGNIFYDNNNPFIINICGFGEYKYNGPHCEYIDLRENKPTWIMSELDKTLSEEKYFMRIVL